MGNLLEILILISLFGCGPTEDRDSGSSGGSTQEDEDTGSSVYIPEGRDDVETEEGASTANDTTGAYLAMPEGIVPVGPAVNVNAAEAVTDANVENWRITIPLDDTSESSRIVLFYHVKREDNKNYYGVIAGGDIEVVAGKIVGNMAGLGNYQPGRVSEAVAESKKAETEDPILTLTEAGKQTTTSFKASDGRLFAGLERNFLLVSDDDGGEFTAKGESDGIGSLIVRDITGASGSKVYVATALGVAISSDNGDSFTMVSESDGLPDRRVNAVYVADSGKVYAATEGGIAEIDGGSVTETWTAESSGLGSDSVNDVYVDSDGDVYAATDAGVSILASGGSTFTNYTASDNSLADEKAHALYVDGSDRLWVATSLGLSVLLSGSSNFITYDESHGFSGVTFSDIDQDDSGNYYGTHDAGVSVFTWDGSSISSEVTNYNKDNGLSTLDLTSGFTKDGDFYVSCVEGLLKLTDGGSEFSEIDY